MSVIYSDLYSVCMNIKAYKIPLMSKEKWQAILCGISIESIKFNKSGLSVKIIRFKSQRRSRLFSKLQTNF